MTEKKITVFIYLPGEVVAVPSGIFTHNGDLNVGRFAYGRQYINRPKAISVDSAALPIAIPPREVTINKGLYGAFRDAAPDQGRLVIQRSVECRQRHFQNRFSPEANATRVGNLDFRLSLEDPEPCLEPPHFNQMERYLRLELRSRRGQGR
jgi:serine/threonine-protein kinase HipA